MKKKVLTVVLMMTMTVSLIAGCGGKEKEADGDKIKLTFLDKHPEEEYKGYFEQAENTNLEGQRLAIYPSRSLSDGETVRCVGE